MLFTFFALGLKYRRTRQTAVLKFSGICTIYGGRGAYSVHAVTLATRTPMNRTRWNFVHVNLNGVEHHLIAGRKVVKSLLLSLPHGILS